ncbi:Cyclin, N-terminal domain containing protein [Trichomonas vaginalis G3]|uniref:Cyclin, N-terminal domain containing protein n=1 Tax=Trichomonas vaginalis (strain ATCC PRA-98 / G3) TaxID=412133 RepID=A2E0T8_TRIV3|nr:cell division [Trichomonas vaginalis G3]EAY13693.1 Cyclin, N-terminal domain containing protein [Trichomonas vaginalis G3]KAI5529603.1 cell division [Trichomonas vaginalis G3]|eukprot:XP_001325916.1 Cyclin, N-terminal domain containing protein [Trichomonas vaginalis G3]
MKPKITKKNQNSNDYVKVSNEGNSQKSSLFPKKAVISVDDEYSDPEIDDDIENNDISIELQHVDLVNLHKPLTVSRYAEIIFRNDYNAEADFVCNLDTFSQVQDEITPKMRKILVTWLINVHNDYGFSNDTLYSAIKYLDIYLSNKKIEKNRLQLLGAVCYWMSCKVNEIQIPYVSELSDLCNIKYTNAEFYSLETEVFTILNFQLNFPTYKGFLRRYLSIIGSNTTIQDISSIICESSLNNFMLSCCLPSEVAIAIILVAYTALNYIPPIETLKKYLKINDFEVIIVIAECVLSTVCELIESKGGATYQKYMDHFKPGQVNFSRDLINIIKKLC